MNRVHPAALAAMIALGVAVIAVIIALVVVHSDESSQITKLRHSLAAVTRQEASDRAQLTGGSGESQSVAARVGKLGTQLSKLQQCIPELQNEITGLGIDANPPPSITNSQQISNYCQSVLYQRSSGP
jgi:predicted PurR-regulated permease PerM